MIACEGRTMQVCTCVYARLKMALSLLEDARERSRMASQALDDGADDHHTACNAVGLLTAAGALRKAAETELRAALHAAEHPGRPDHGCASTPT